MANVQIVLSALNNASSSITKVKADIKQLGDSGKTAEGGVKGLGAALGGAWTTALAAAGAIAAVGAAIGKTYEIAKEGAELEYAEDRFNNLAIAAGTAADVLLGDMREATKGMMSDAELVASGADLMALGLAKSHDEVVRLTSVAGALNMNMNQLVLTLTNQTTMRFDALGVSVDGFQEKVKALEAAGLSANDAFKEAFLQQAEEQILKVGSAADSSIGAFQRMEAAQANYFNALKADLVEAGTWWAQFWEGVYNDNLSVRAYNSLIDQANALGINTRAIEMAVLGGEDYVKTMLEGTGLRYQDMKVTADQIEQNKAAVDALGEQVKYQSEMNVMRSRGTNANYEYSASEKLVADAGQAAAEAAVAVADATNNADMAMRSYTESLLFKIASEGLSEQAAYDLAIAMGLVDQNTVAATEQTNIYKQMLDAGVITQTQYNLLVKDLADDIENLPEGKTLEIDDNIDEVLADLKDLETWKSKPIPVKLSLDTSAVDGYRPPTKYGTVAYQPNQLAGQAVGGSVNAGNPYNWQEYGYRGEVFVPSADGFVLSRADAERALARALYGGGSAIDPAAIGKAVAQAMSGVTAKGKGGNVYNLTMPTSSNPADVRTAFELMEAWGA
jgi:hypothetical protein